MKTNIEIAIDILVSRITLLSTQDEALKLTQAALNLAHVQATLVGSTKLQQS
jgi:hypothetical protein